MHVCGFGVLSKYPGKVEVARVELASHSARRRMFDAVAPPERSRGRTDDLGTFHSVKSA